MYPLIDSTSSLIVVEIPKADGLEDLFTPDEHYEPNIEEILDEMIWARVSLQQLFDFAKGVELKYGPHKHTYYIFDAEQYSADEVKNWLRQQPQIARYTGVEHPVPEADPVSSLDISAPVKPRKQPQHVDYTTKRPYKTVRR